MMLAMKRSRAPNFTMLEIKHLLRLIEKYPVIESKKNDGATVKEKQDAWQMLTFEYNSLANFSTRTPEKLWACYRNYKKKLKKAHSRGELAITAPSLLHNIEEHGQEWGNVPEPETTNQNISGQMECNQLVNKVKIEVYSTEESPPASPSYSNDPIQQVKTPIGPSLGGDEEFTKEQPHMKILPIKFPLDDSQQIQSDKTPDSFSFKLNQDQRVHIMKKEIDPSLASEKKGNIKKVSPSFQELANEKKDLIRAQKELLDLQIKHQELEIRLTEEKLDFEKKKNKIELDFLQQKYGLELNYLKNKRQD